MCPLVSGQMTLDEVPFRTHIFGIPSLGLVVVVVFHVFDDMMSTVRILGRLWAFYYVQHLCIMIPRKQRCLMTAFYGHFMVGSEKLWMERRTRWLGT